MSECPVKLLQDPSELSDLLHMFRKLKPERVLEVGSLYGGTLWCWINNMATGGLVVSVDMIANNKIHKQGDILDDRKLWAGWAETAKVELITLIGNSGKTTIIQSVEEYSPFDFIFIDGGHEYKTANNNYEIYWPMLRKGGIMAFHDIGSSDENVNNIDVGRWWRDMRQMHRFEGKVIDIVARQGRWGIGVLIKS